ADPAPGAVAYAAAGGPDTGFGGAVAVGRGAQLRGSARPGGGRRGRPHLPGGTVAGQPRAVRGAQGRRARETEPDRAADRGIGGGDRAGGGATAQEAAREPIVHGRLCRRGAAAGAPFPEAFRRAD